MAVRRAENVVPGDRVAVRMQVVPPKG
jgi:hypothetical protein